MTARKPIVQIGGTLQELPAGDSLDGAGASSIVGIRFYTAAGVLRPVISFITTFRKADASEVALPII